MAANPTNSFKNRNIVQHCSNFEPGYFIYATESLALKSFIQNDVAGAPCLRIDTQGSSQPFQRDLRVYFALDVSQ